MDYILHRTCSLKEMGDCKMVTDENIARQHRTIECRMTLVIQKEEKSKRRAVDQAVNVEERSLP